MKTAKDGRVLSRGLTGVRDVANLIEIKPVATAADVKERIEDALKRNAEVEAGAIRIAVDDGVVTLEGRIKAWPERAVIERAGCQVGERQADALT